MKGTLTCRSSPLLPKSAGITGTLRIIGVHEETRKVNHMHNSCFTLRAVAALMMTVVVMLVSPSLGYHIGVVAFPEVGHLNPLLSVVEAAAAKGHTTTIYGPDMLLDHCQREIHSFTFATCVSVGFYDVSPYNESYMQALVQMTAITSLTEVTKHVTTFNKFLVTALHATIVATTSKPDILLVDFGAWAATAVGDVLGIPSVMLWPLTLQFPLETNPSIPALGSARSLHMTWTERWANFLHQRLFVAVSLLSTEQQQNEVRARIGAPPVSVYNLYFQRTVLTPSIFGLDIAQPLCPNVHAVGFLHRVRSASDWSNDHVPEDWATYMDSCSNGIIYINMGSVAVLPDTWLHRIESAALAFSTQQGRCVVWKLSKRQLSLVADARAAMADGGKLRLSNHIPFSPRLLLAHKNCALFVTHCGDTSVYESIHNLVPMVGIPLFADQMDMCARLQDARVGESLDKFTFTVASLRDAAERILGDRVAIRSRLVSLQNVGIVLGGAARAASVLESVAGNPDLASMTFCEHVTLPWYQRHEVDVLALTSLVISIVFGGIAAACRRICCRRTKQKID